MSYFYVDSSASVYTDKQRRKQASIDKMTGMRVVKPKQSRRVKKPVLYSVHIPTIRRRREAKLIRKDPFRDNGSYLSWATEMNTVIRSATTMTF